jgi:hypothetical protein
MDIIDYKYNEGKTLKEVQVYIDGTYDEHYSKNNYQATEFIIDGGHGEGFCIGNIMKYAQRYGKKNGYDRNDLMKIIHYAVIAMYNHDLKNKNLDSLIGSNLGIKFEIDKNETIDLKMVDVDEKSEDKILGF